MYGAMVEVDDTEDEEPHASIADDEEEYNMRNFGISRALPVPEGTPDFEAGPPQTAEEYLQWVRYEANHCPQVVRVDISPDKLRSSAGDTGVSSSYLSKVGRAQLMPEGPAWSQPSNSWTRQLLLDFRQLRQQLVVLAEEHELELSTVKLPHSKDLQTWNRICFGPGGDAGGAPPPPPPPPLSQPPEHQQPQADAGASDTPDPAPQQQQQQRPLDKGDGKRKDAGAAPPPSIEQLSGPLLKTVLALDQVRVVALVTQLVEEFEDMVALSYSRSQWLFALSACLEKPIHCDTGATFRSLMRKCCVLRASLQDRHDPQLPGLNTLIAVAGGYFGQDERLARLVADEELP